MCSFEGYTDTGYNKFKGGKSPKQIFKHDNPQQPDTFWIIKPDEAHGSSYSYRY